MYINACGARSLRKIPIFPNKHSRYSTTEVPMLVILLKQGKKYFPWWCLVQIYDFTGAGICFRAREAFESRSGFFFLRKDVVPDRMELECQRSHLVDAGRISQKSGRYQLLHPLNDEKEIALDCPQAGFLWWHSFGGVICCISWHHYRGCHGMWIIPEDPLFHQGCHWKSDTRWCQ